MSNHLHAVLRSRQDVVKGWTDEEVARRWWNLFPSRRNKDGSPAEPAETDLKSLMADAKVLVELRARLWSISWFMRCTSEVIARLANAEHLRPVFEWQICRDDQALTAIAALTTIAQSVSVVPQTATYLRPHRERSLFAFSGQRPWQCERLAIWAWSDVLRSLRPEIPATVPVLVTRRHQGSIRQAMSLHKSH